MSTSGKGTASQGKEKWRGPKVDEFLEKIRKVGVGEVIIGCVMTAVSLVVTLFESGKLHEMDVALYMTIAGSVMFIITGSLGIYMVKHDSKVLFRIVFYLGVVATIYEIALLGYLIYFFVHNRDIFKDKEGRRLAAIIVSAVLGTLIVAAKLVYVAVLGYYAALAAVYYAILSGFDNAESGNE